MWEDNYKPYTYEICDNFLNVIYFIILKKNAPRISEESIYLVALMGDRYAKYFSLILGYGVANQYICYLGLSVIG